jgi:hypothetical protein
MKILGIILAVLMLAGTAFVDLAAANKSHKLAGQISELTSGLTAEQQKMVSKSADVPSSGRLNGGAGLGVIGGLAALVLLIATFAKKDWVKMLAAVTVGATAISAIIYPYVHTGPMDGAAPRPLALIGLALAVVGAGGAFIATRQKA